VKVVEVLPTVVTAERIITSAAGIGMTLPVLKVKERAARSSLLKEGAAVMTEIMGLHWTQPCAAYHSQGLTFSTL
jgi:hypothetical protein